MNRAEAFAEAEKIVARLAPATNSRGYLEGVLSPSARISEIIRVAEWLLVDAAAEKPSSEISVSVDVPGTSTDISSGVRSDRAFPGFSR